MKMSGHFNPVNKDETQYNRQLILTTNTLDQSVPMMSVKIFWFIVPREYNIVNAREEKISEPNKSIFCLSAAKDKKWE